MPRRATSRRRQGHSAVETACNGQTAITYSTFNAASLSPNDLTYICGTITTNAAQIIPNGSGTSGNPITIKFDTGASFSPAACNLGGGSNICFNLNGLSWIVVDGGTPCGPGTACNSDEEGNVSDDTGVISNTANGVGPKLIRSTVKPSSVRGAVTLKSET